MDTLNLSSYKLFVMISSIIGCKLSDPVDRIMTESFLWLRVGFADPEVISSDLFFLIDSIS